MRERVKTEKVLFQVDNKQSIALDVDINLVDLFKTFSICNIIPIAYTEDLFREKVEKNQQVMISFVNEEDLKFFIEKVIGPFDEAPDALYSRVTRAGTPWATSWKFSLHIDDFSVKTKKRGRKNTQFQDGDTQIIFYYETVFPFSDLKFVTEKMQDYVKSLHKNINNKYEILPKSKILSKKDLN